MQGMSRDTGKLLIDEDHLRQSIRMILTTPLGSRVMRPGFGSELPKLVAAPMTADTELRIYAATIDALAKWEPRIEIQQVQLVSRNANGELTLELTGIYNSERIQLPISIGGTVESLPETELGPSTPTTPEIPLDPSIPITPDNPLNLLVFGNDKTLVFDNNKTFGWRSS